MKIAKSDNKIPLLINSKRKMARISISVDGSTPIHLEFTPTHSIPWMIQNFVFYQELDLHVYGVRGGKIPDSALEIDWLPIKWPPR